MPIGAFRLNSIAKVLSTQPPETTYNTGWYSYTTDSGENNTSYVSNHQIAIMGYNSDYSIRGVAAIQPQTDTNNYLLPFKWNYSDNTWTIGTKVVTQAAPTDYKGFTGRKAVSELYPTSAGVVDATNYGAHYIPGNNAADRKIIPFTMNANGDLTILTGTATDSPSIGTSQDSGDLVYIGQRNSTPTYAFFTREDAGNNTIAVFTRSGNSLTKIPGINSFGAGNRTTVEGADLDASSSKGCFIVINQNGQIAAVRVASDNTYGISTTGTTGLTGKITATNIWNLTTASNLFLLYGMTSDGTRWATQLCLVSWFATPTITLYDTVPFDTTANTPELGYQQNVRVEKGWANDEAMIFYIRSGVLYGRYGKRNSSSRMVFDAEQTFVSMSNARSFDVQPVYIDATHRYFLGMINNSAGENVDGDMNLFAIRAQQITTPAQMYNIRLPATSVNEGSSMTFNVDTIGVTDTTTLYWTVQTNAGDFSTSSGSFTISSNTGTFSVTPTADATTEGAETFTVSVRTGSTSGTIVATTPPITINDTSLSKPTALTFTQVNTTTTTTIQLPSAGLIAGRSLGILIDRSTTTTDVTPAGWTTISNVTTTGIRTNISYKSLSASDHSTTISGMGGTVRKVLFVLGTDIAWNSFTVTVNGAQATTATPTNQTMTFNGAGSPIIGISVGAINSTNTPSTTLTSQSSSYAIASVAVKWRIENTGSTTNSTATMTDGGTNTLQTFTIRFD